MSSPRTRSAALLVSIYIDAEGGAPWYAQLRAFADPSAPEYLVERVSDEAQLVSTIGRWLETVLQGEITQH